jgi:Protein of unknown function (DUF2975)
MEIKITTKQILIVLTIIVSLIFIGVCIEAGSFLFNMIYTLAVKPAAAEFFYNHLSLLSLYQFGKSHFITVMSLVNIVAALRVIMFFVILKFLYNKKLDFSKPFNMEMRRFILIIGYIALGISFFSAWGTNYTDRLVSDGVTMPSIHQLRIAGADVWVFMSVVLFVIAQIFKRGIEIQTENDLTV